MKLNKERILKSLRSQFLYDENGIPNLYEFGEFKRGVTNEEIKQYLQVRANTLNIKKLQKKFDKEFGCQTVSCIFVNGISVTLFYRSDVVRCANDVFNNRKHYPLD